MPLVNPLRGKIEDRSALIGVIGLGYVGLPQVRAFHDAGFAVLGLDIDADKIALLRRGECYLKHLGADFVSAMLPGGRFEATSDFSRLAEPDAIIVCVPTPLGPHQEPDLSYIENTTDAIAATLRPGQLIVLASTTYPGTTRHIMLPRLEARQGAPSRQGGAPRKDGAPPPGAQPFRKGAPLRCGVDFFLAFSPEREDPGRKDYTTRTIPKLVGGIDAASGALAAALYRQAVATVVEVSTAEVAEAAKLLENIYRAVNIALVNEMKVVLAAMNIDIWEVIAAAATKPFGFQPFYPGPGLGGHCIPIDPFYLAWKAREAGQPTRFIELAGQINRAMPDYVVQRVALALNDRSKSVKGSRILVLGLAYKPDIDDVRESPSFELIEKLEALGAAVDYNDPHVPRTHKMRRYDLNMESVPLTPQALAGYDCVIIATDHGAYDWRFIAEHARLVVDTRNAMRQVMANRDRITPA
jgi:UDP-N-acetyl-D-glucosamine dehydrogenase